MFWYGLHCQIFTWYSLFEKLETKRVLGMIIMIVESAYSVALFVFLIFNFGEHSWRCIGRRGCLYLF